MFRFGLILAGLLAAVVVVSAGAEARADHGSMGFGGSCGPTRSYSTRSYDNFGGYGRGAIGGYGSGGYSRGWSGRGSTHYDYQPAQVQIHRGHIDVQPGHYDRHSSRNWGW